MRPKFLFYLFVSFCLISCDNEDDTVCVDFDEDTFVENLNNWNQLNLQNYSYEYSNSGYSYSGIASNIGIVIVDGDVDTLVALTENGIQDADSYLIDDLFAEIQSTFVDNEDRKLTSEVYIKEIEVVYDEQYFYPKEVHYIYHVPEEMVGIWNMHQYIEKFEVE
ncbi:DUF6174 domain-containing protein [Ancylomarina sp. 16SWW S1-10-2]|uniref:DUF6174 domain-containing protein n=1 Tax=Ancylomarina sp. 16SWW S1-10-2 TaxID=2499681 RepID=UPI0012AD31B0|nr:DUF6174 domain-containing protein [Ancylomarina sp. 16SWW S1-10-2]MRT94509.1 hypothetical protein [Ancylomarina sp. 16SWW S1-10-2]